VEADTKATIESAVAAILPPLNSASSRPRVTITTFDDPALPVRQSTAPPQWPRWLTDQRAALGLIWFVLALVALVARGWFQKAKSNAGPAPSPLKVVSGDPAASVGRSPAADSDGQHPLREELRDLVERDPDAAVRAITQWIDKAG
jgi:hypothetical protein